MMNLIWAGMMLAALICGMATGRGSEVTAAMFSGAGDAVTLGITLLGVMCLWSGLMRVADRAGITRALARLFTPVLRVLFPGLKPDSTAARAISMNVSANLLGMGNAATPFGLAAMKELARECPEPGTASDAMVTFVVMNTACLQLIPSTIAVLRSAAGSAQPFDLMPCIWATSLLSLCAGLTAAWLLRNATAAGKLRRSSRQSHRAHSVF